MDTDILLTIKFHQQLFADPRRIALLKAIAHTGSLSQGAKQIGISYKTAWDAINEMNLLAKNPFVISSAGGKGGGGAKLSPYGIRFIQLYDLMTQMQTHAFKLLNDDDSIALDDILAATAKLSLQSSARNQLYGTIEQINVFGVTGMMSVLLNDQQTTVWVSITQASISRLQLAVNKSVILLIKAPQIILNPTINRQERYSNYYPCTIKRYSYDETWCELNLVLPSGLMLYATEKQEIALEMLKVTSQIMIAIDPENIIVATMV